MRGVEKIDVTEQVRITEYDHPPLCVEQYFPPNNGSSTHIFSPYPRSASHFLLVSVIPVSPSFALPRALADKKKNPKCLSNWGFSGISHFITGGWGDESVRNLGWETKDTNDVSMDQSAFLLGGGSLVSITLKACVSHTV